MPKVLIVDDSAILRRALRGILDLHPGWECCGEADTGEAAIVAAAELKPDAVVMDVSMPGMGGVKATEAIHSSYPSVKIVILSWYKSGELLHAVLSAGATGYILKSDAERQLIAALNAVVNNQTYTTDAIAPAGAPDPA
jgi:DNA-binding NarL/FixJ family response regulator